MNEGQYDSKNVEHIFNKYRSCVQWNGLEK